MNASPEHLLLRVFLRTGDRSPLTPTYELLVKAARQQGLAGVTVLKGIYGFGSRGIAHSSAMSIVEHAPIIVEIVDHADAIQSFVDHMRATFSAHGLATFEPVKVLLYRTKAKSIISRITETSVHPRFDMTQDGILLRVFIGESDKSESGKPLFEAIVQKARELGIAGATVLRGVEGFGANSVVHKSKLLEMSSDLPIIIEIVDRKEKIEAILPGLEPMVKDGMITLEQVGIVAYRDNPANPLTS